MGDVDLQYTYHGYFPGYRQFWRSLPRTRTRTHPKVLGAISLDTQGPVAASTTRSTLGALLRGTAAACHAR